MTDLIHAPGKDSTLSIHDFFSRTNRFVITSHVRPDGDAVGSVLALGLSLTTLGKSVQMILSDGAFRNFHYLEGANLIKDKIAGEYDAVIALDSSDMMRLGSALANLEPDLNVDHHITNRNYARLNWVEPEASATCEILAEHMPAWGLPITKPVANALLAGILIDTIGFKTPNVTQKTLKLASDLVEAGANLSDIYSKALDSHSFEALQYWGYGFQSMQRNGKVVWASLSLEGRRAANYEGNDDADLINMLSTIDSAVVALIFVEQKNGTVKVSWRAKPGWDVAKIASQFGGGGHKAAAGADIEGTLEQIRSDVLSTTIKLIK